MTWRVPHPDDLLWEAWETDYSLFNPSSGETHLLNELPAEALRRLADAPKDEASLAEEMAQACEIENTASWKRKIGAMLSQLETLGLIEKVRA